MIKETKITKVNLGKQFEYLFCSTKQPIDSNDFLRALLRVKANTLIFLVMKAKRIYAFF